MRRKATSSLRQCAKSREGHLRNLAEAKPKAETYSAATKLRVMAEVENLAREIKSHRAYPAISEEHQLLFHRKMTEIRALVDPNFSLNIRRWVAAEINLEV